MVDPNLPDQNETEDSGALEQALSQVPRVQVDRGFLPSVMSKVYVSHARASLKPMPITLISIGLLILSSIFFLFDVQAYQAENQIESFGAAYLEKLELILTQVNHSFHGVTGLLSASWHLLSGLVGYLLDPSRLGWFIGLVAALILFWQLARRGALSLYGVKK